MKMTHYDTDGVVTGVRIVDPGRVVHAATFSDLWAGEESR